MTHDQHAVQGTPAVKRCCTAGAFSSFWNIYVRFVCCAVMIIPGAQEYHKTMDDDLRRAAVIVVSILVPEQAF